MAIHTTYCQSKIGLLKIKAADDGLLYVGFAKKKSDKQSKKHPLLLKSARELNEYFLGKRKFFSLKPKPSGTAFQRKVWGELLKIPFGSKISYGDLARRMGRPKAARAVGGAVGKNKIAIVIPCHRVIGCGNRISSYAHGVKKKAWLLRHEGLEAGADAKEDTTGIFLY